MYCASSLPVTSATAVASPLVPLASKSDLSTFATSSLKVTRKLRLSALVCSACALVPSWRSMDTTVAAPVSTGTLSCVAAALPLPARSRTWSLARSTSTLPMTPVFGVMVAVHTSGSDVPVTAVALPLVTVRSAAVNAPAPLV